MNKQYDLNTIKALVVVSAKEHGKIYLLEHGSLNGLSYTEEHPPTHSDNEGFFTRSAGGAHLGSGSVKETDDTHNLQEYIKAITGELRTITEKHQPDVVFVIEPEHLKGHIKANLINAHNVPVEEVAYGNYVEQDAAVIHDLIKKSCGPANDPTDPSSVAGEENAAEKRKILETGKEVSG